MNLFMGVCLVLCISSSLAVATKGVVIKLDQKPKREAPLPGGGSYHRPSYKYLPPGLSSGSYDFGSSGPSSYHHGGHGASLGFASHSSFGGSHHRPSSFESFMGGSPHHGGHHVSPSSGYRYPSPSSFGSAGFGDHSYSSHGHGPAGISLGSSHKPHSFVIPSHSLGAELGVGASLAGVSSHGYHYSKGVGSGSSFGSHGPSFGHHTFGSSGLGGYSGSSHGNSHGHGYQYESPTHSYPSASGVSGYSYEKPAPSYEHASQSHIPASSYGVPSNAVVASYNKYQGSSYSAGGNAEEGPSYALGHKGLGHFNFASSKPLALNTNFIDSNKLQHAGAHSHSYAEASKAPFKPSTFLGSTQETSGPSYSSHHNEYEQPASQYLPPTSNGGAPSGYNYQPPSEPASLYGAPTGGHDEHANIHEPESNYLPPQQQQPLPNYLPPSDTYLPPNKPAEQYLPPSGPQESYLPPSNSYGVPH